MNANEFTFGVEIETIADSTLPERHDLRIGRYRNGIQVPYLPTGWTAESDSSIHSTRPGLACEIVSPILRGEEGLKQVATVLMVLDEMGHRVNPSCGVHVHVGWAGSAVALARLITIVAHLEKGLYAITGTKSREYGSYCGGIRKYNDKKNAKQRIDRYRCHILNLTNLAYGRRPTVEFRVFSGSLSTTKVLGWIQVCLGLVERALNGKRDACWSPKQPIGGWKKAGPGQSEAERLIGYLAWGKGYACIHGGKQFGWISDAIPQDAIKTEFRRLAKAYDSMP